MIGNLQAGQAVDTELSNTLTDAFNKILSHGEEQERENDGHQKDAKRTDELPTYESLPSENLDAVCSEYEELFEKCWKITFAPENTILLSGNEPLRIFKELAGLGKITATAHTQQVPNFHDLVVDECFLSWSIDFFSDSATEQDILDVFELGY